MRYSLQRTRPLLLISLPGIDEAPLSIGDGSASGSPLEALHLPDGATVGSGEEKRPRPTERPHSSLLYPCGGEPQQTDEENSLHLQGEDISGGKSQIKTNFGKKCVPLSPGIDEAPLSIGDSSASGKALEALHLTDGTTVGREIEKRPQPTERPHSRLIYT